MRLFLALLIIILLCGCVNNVQETTTTTLKRTTTTVSETTSTLSEPTTTLPPIKGDFEVYEWGVLVGCVNNDSHFLTSRSEQVYLVKQPVIYVHSKDKKPFTIEVKFNSGTPTDTYPEATVDEGDVVWRDVLFSRSCEKGEKIKAVGAYVPLKDILDTLNDVDSDCLDYNGQNSRFLFYEGELKFENKIHASYNFENKKAIFKNNGGYPVYNLILVASKYGSYLFNPDVYIARSDKLNPGEEKTLIFEKQENVDFVEDLSSQGFTQKEAEAFSKVWKAPFIYPSNTAGWANLIYRLPQSEYDKITTINITPQPNKVTRTLYVLIHLTNNSS